MRLKGLMMGCAVAFAASSLMATGCASNDGDGSGDRDGGFGTAALALTGQTNGTTYRLRNASFDISGPTNTTLSSESDPNGSVLATTLTTGSYLITLADGWFLERVNGTGADVVQATLVSANPQMFGISQGATSNVVYQFDTDGSIVTIGIGRLDISIAVNEIGSASCDLLQQTGCPAGQGCYIGSDPSSGVCAVPQAQDQPGSPCQFQNTCATPGFCGSTDGENNTCIAACSVSGMGPTCPGGLTCLPLDIGDLGGCL